MRNALAKLRCNAIIVWRNYCIPLCFCRKYGFRFGIIGKLVPVAGIKVWKQKSSVQMDPSGQSLDSSQTSIAVLNELWLESESEVLD